LRLRKSNGQKDSRTIGDPMADSARPVSGEIMTEPLAAVPWPAAREAAPDIVDADFEVLSRPSAPDAGPSGAVESPPSSAPAPPSLEGMAMLRPAEAVRPFSMRGGPVFWAAGVAAALAAFWISGGHALVRHSALFAAGSGEPAMLSVTGVTSHVDASGERPVLFVDGEAGNDGHEAAALPPLEIRVTGDDGAVTRYTLGTSGRALAPGQRFAFSSRLDVPRNGIRAVAVSFAE
jgi:hypothetical protein